MGTLENRMSKPLARWSPALLFAALLSLPGCHYYADPVYDNGYRYSISVTAVAVYDTAYSGTEVPLFSDYDLDNVEVYITDQDWTVISAPVSAVFALDDYGRDATLLPVTPGTYVVMYRTWYYTNYDYYDYYCYCYNSSGYRESYVTVTVFPAPST